MKKCNNCDVLKSLKEFSKHPTISDGHYNQCKSCRLLDRNKRELARFNPLFEGSKSCLRCLKNLPKVQFVLNKSSKDGFNGWCKPCSKDSALLSKYSISLEEYQKQLHKQNFKCAICKTDDARGVSNSFVVDHCHKTGKIRGLLCNHCNTGLGKLGDSIESIKRVLEYLESSCGKIGIGEPLEKK